MALSIWWASRAFLTESRLLWISSSGTRRASRAVASMRQDEALASSRAFAKIEKNTVREIIPKKHLPLNDKRLTRVRCAKKGFEKTQVVCNPAISLIWYFRVTGYVTPATTSGS